MLALLNGVANPTKILRATRGEVNWTIKIMRKSDRSAFLETVKAQMILISQSFTVSHNYVQFTII